MKHALQFPHSLPRGLGIVEFIEHHRLVGILQADGLKGVEAVGVVQLEDKSRQAVETPRASFYGNIGSKPRYIIAPPASGRWLFDSDAPVCF